MESSILNQLRIIQPMSVYTVPVHRTFNDGASAALTVSVGVVAGAVTVPVFAPARDKRRTRADVGAGRLTVAAHGGLVQGGR